MATTRSTVFRLGHRETTLLVICLVLLCASPSSQQTRCEPVNVGLIAAMPWDISNTLRAPIAGPVSLALSAVMALILLFGFLLAPVNYILGYPSRIYHPARKPGILQELVYSETPKNPLEELAPILGAIANRTADEMYREENIDSADFSESRKLSLFPDEFGKMSSKSSSFPDFVSSAFFLIPEKDVECRKLILCHAHGFLNILPTRVTKMVRFLSKRIVDVPDEYQSAVVLGLSNQAECQNTFKCSKNISDLLKDVLYNFLSSETREFWKLQKLF